MKASRLLGSVLLIAAAFAVSITAQVADAPAIHVVFINTDAFGGKDGITKYVKALDAAIGEPSFVLHSMRVKLEALAKEIKQMRDQPIEEGSADKLRAKLDEYQKLDIEAKRIGENEEATFERRKREVLPPVLEDISRAMKEFAAQKGYSVILDAAKLEEAVLVYEAATVDVTTEFIAFYNARSAMAAKPQ